MTFVQAQGKLLTPAQKLAKQRAEAMLEAMRAQVSESLTNGTVPLLFNPAMG
jgi:hypothetical protein